MVVVVVVCVWWTEERGGRGEGEGRMVGRHWHHLEHHLARPRPDADSSSRIGLHKQPPPNTLLAPRAFSPATLPHLFSFSIVVLTCLAFRRITASVSLPRVAIRVKGSARRRSLQAFASPSLSLTCSTPATTDISIPTVPFCSELFSTQSLLWRCNIFEF